MTRILLIGDEAEIRPTLTQQPAHQREFVIESDGDAALTRATKEPFDLIALDFKRPSASRFDIFRKFQRWGIKAPVLLWTAVGQLPWEIRRQTPVVPQNDALAASKAPVYEFGNVRVDTQSGRVSRSGTPIFVSTREFQLLKYFIRRRGQDVSREDLLTDVWGFDPRMRTRTVDVHLAWIRQKLESQPRHPEYFLTIRGLGYKFAG